MQKPRLWQGAVVVYIPIVVTKTFCHGLPLQCEYLTEWLGCCHCVTDELPTRLVQCIVDCVQGQLWFNLDSAFSPLYIQILPLVASRDPLKRYAAAQQHALPMS
jgi:hypothetical protein